MPVIRAARLFDGVADRLPARPLVLVDDGRITYSLPRTSNRRWATAAKIDMTETNMALVTPPQFAAWQHRHARDGFEVVFLHDEFGLVLEYPGIAVRAA